MRYPGLALLLVCLLALSGFAQEPLKVGDPVPEFKLPYATKDSIIIEGLGSEDLAGTRYLLAFYPADWSPGCTKELCTFRDHIADFAELDIDIYPVSGDYVFSHHEWALKHNLPFKLLADHTREVGMTFGVYRPDWGMFERSVFVVGPDGKFEYIDYRYSIQTEDDFQALKKALKEEK